MKRLAATIVFTVFFWCMCFAQHDTIFRFERSFDYSIESFTVNSLGELFLINANNQLKKIDEKGDSVGVFNMVTSTVSFLM